MALKKYKLSREYRVVLEDGSGKYILAKGKVDARQQMNKYLREICGFGGRYGGKLPKIIEIN